MVKQQGCSAQRMAYLTPLLKELKQKAAWREI